jgi:hypothetical protein
VSSCGALFSLLSHGVGFVNGLCCLVYVVVVSFLLDFGFVVELERVIGLLGVVDS